MHSYEQVGSEQLWETILLLRRTAQAIWCLRFHLGSPAHHRGQIRITTSVLLTPACASGVPSDRFAWGCHPGLHPMAPRQRQPCMGKSSAGQCLSGAQLLQSWKPPPHPVGVLALRPSDARGASQSQVRRKQGPDRTRDMDRESRHQRMQGPLGWAMERDKPLGGLQHAPRPSLVGFSVSRRA